MTDVYWERAADQLEKLSLTNDQLKLGSQELQVFLKERVERLDGEERDVCSALLVMGEKEFACVHQILLTRRRDER